MDNKLKKSLLKALSKKMRELRDKSGYSQEHISIELLNRDRTFISKIESQSSVPSLTSFLQIAKAFNISPSSLMKSIENDLEY